MVQDVHVHQVEELASRDCGNARADVTICDSMGPAAREEAANTFTTIIKIDRIGFSFLALRLEPPRTPLIGSLRVSHFSVYQLDGFAAVPHITVSLWLAVPQSFRRQLTVRARHEVGIIPHSWPESQLWTNFLRVKIRVGTRSAYPLK